MIHSAPEGVPLAIDLHEDLVEMPLPPGVGAKLLNPFSSDLRGKHRTEPIPPVPHCLVAYIDPAFMKEIFNVSERQREPDVHHNGPADDPWARFEVAKRRGLGHAQTLGKPLPVQVLMLLTLPS